MCVEELNEVCILLSSLSWVELSPGFSPSQSQLSSPLLSDVNFADREPDHYYNNDLSSPRIFVVFSASFIIIFSYFNGPLFSSFFSCNITHYPYLKIPHHRTGTRRDNVNAIMKNDEVKFVIYVALVIIRFRSLEHSRSASDFDVWRGWWALLSDHHAIGQPVEREDTAYLWGRKETIDICG